MLSGSEGAARVALDIGLAFAFLLALFALARFGGRAVAALIGSDDDELLTLGFVGLALLVAGASGELGVSDAIGALMIGLVVSQTRLRERVERLVLPLRDTFAAVFFVAFGLSIDVGALGDVVVPVVLAVLRTLVLNVTAGLITARLYRLNQRSAANIGLSVLGRGGFSLILASLGVAAGLDARLGPFVALYVLVLAVVSPLLASRSELLARRIPDRLLVSNWQYVRQETMTTSCAHLDSVLVTETDKPMVCALCQAAGDDWVHLRLCLSCGTVACCDDSRNQHASRHHRESGHPLIASLEPGDDWQWCYVDQTLVVDGLGSR